MNSKLQNAFFGPRFAFPLRHKGGACINRAMTRQTVRYYARVTGRRTTVTEEQRRTDTQTGMILKLEWRSSDDPQQKQEQPAWWQRKEEPIQQQYYERETQETEGSAEQAITPEVSAFLSKVYGTMMGGMGTAAVGAAVGTIMPGLAFPAMIATFVGIIGLAFAQKPSIRTSLFIGVTGLLGLSIGPLVAASSAGAIAAAALGTTGIFGGFTLMALKAKRRAMLSLGGPLLGCLIGLVLCSLGGMFLPMLGVTNPAVLAALYNINLYGGLALFSVFISYDTQRMIESYHEGNRDHIGPALNMFLNLFNIFVRLLQIFRE